MFIGLHTSKTAKSIQATLTQGIRLGLGSLCVGTVVLEMSKDVHFETSVEIKNHRRNKTGANFRRNFFNYREEGRLTFWVIVLFIRLFPPEHTTTPRAKWAPIACPHCSELSYSAETLKARQVNIWFQEPDSYSRKEHRQ